MSVHLPRVKTMDIASIWMEDSPVFVSMDLRAYCVKKVKQNSQVNSIVFRKYQL